MGIAYKVFRAASCMAATVLCLSGCATRARNAAPSWIEDFRIEPASVRAVRMNEHFPIPEIPVSINGRLVSLELDTGAPRGFMLTDATPEDYGLQVLSVVRERNTDGSDRGFDAYSVAAGELLVLGLPARYARGTVSSWKVFSDFPFQGTISPESLGARRLVIDYPNRLLALSELATPADLPLERNCAVKALPIPERYGANVYLPGRIGGRDIVVYVDTGSSPSSIGPEVFEEAGLKGARKRGRLWAASIEFSIGDHEFTLNKALVTPIKRGFDFDVPVGIALGSALLSSFFADAPDRDQRKAGIPRLPQQAKEGRLVGDIEPERGEAPPALDTSACPEPGRPFVIELPLYHDLVFHLDLG
jgi:hypothetical protein